MTRLLDLTRLVSRVGRGPLTGVDRVESAYLDRLLAAPQPVFGLMRSKLGYLLLDRAGMVGVQRLVAGAVLGPADMISRLSYRHDPLRAQAEAVVRRLAVERSPSLRWLLRRVPSGSYLNVGHAHLTSLGAIRSAGWQIAILVHDTIPLDYPQFARAGTAAVFVRKLAAVSAHADLVIHTTQDARLQTEAHFAAMGRVPAGVVAGLGVPKPLPDSKALPPGLDLTRPYFVALGTVEPRKNHTLLLDIWDRKPAARLLIIGGRGWADAALFDRIAATDRVEWHQGLADGVVAAALQGARALLAPSLAEGFGLPVIEAAALGVPVIANDLPVTRELLGDYAVYLDSTEVYPWMETMRVRGTGADRQRRIDPPTWEAHFNAVLSLV